MALSLFDAKGTPLEQQRFTWRELVGKPISKLDDDAFTRVRIILMNGIEAEALRFGHIAARLSAELREPLAAVRRIEQHQQTLINRLLGADHSPLETTIGYEQVAIEVTAALARTEPDPYVAQALRFAMLEDFDHLFRYSALMDRLTGMDANNILQCYTDILAGRPTSAEHRAPHDDLARHWDKRTAAPLTKLHTMTITAGEQQTHDYYMNVGPQFADPIARQVYAEIASIEEQHVTQYESLLDIGAIATSCAKRSARSSTCASAASISCRLRRRAAPPASIARTSIPRAPPPIPWLPVIIGGLAPSSTFASSISSRPTSSLTSGALAMEKSAELALKNRTGLQMSPRHARELLEAVHGADGAPAARNGHALAAARGVYIAEAEPLGTVPAPASLRGVLRSGAKIVSGLRPQVFIDKLAERAAFERGGTRLYEALIAKFAAESASSASIAANTDLTEQRLLGIREEEARHFALVCECIESLGADPTVETPSADVIGVASRGLLQVVSDPRTSLTQSLQAVLAAELIDRDGWELLITMADELGERDSVASFREALKEEDEHLLSVRRWYVTLSLAASGAD